MKLTCAHRTKLVDKDCLLGGCANKLHSAKFLHAKRVKWVSPDEKGLRSAGAASRFVLTDARTRLE